MPVFLEEGLQPFTVLRPSARKYDLFTRGGEIGGRWRVCVCGGDGGREKKRERERERERTRTRMGQVGTGRLAQAGWS